MYQTDTPSYIEAIEWYLGDSTKTDRLQRFSKPLPLLLPTFFYIIFKIPIAWSLLFQQGVAYTGCLFFAHQITAHLSNRKQAGFVVCLLVCCQPMAIYGLAMLTDALGWCWGLAGIYWSLLLYGRAVPKRLEFLQFGAFMALGLFVKESAAMAGVFTFIYWLRHPKIISAFFYMALGGITIVVSGLLLTEWLFETSLVSWIAFNHSDTNLYGSPLKAFLFQSARTLDNFWIFVGLGTYVLWKKRKVAPAAFIYGLTGGVIWGIMPLVWPYTIDRILFIIAPFMLFLASYSCVYFSKRQFFGLIFFGGILQLVVTYFIYIHKIGGLLVFMYLLFFIVVLISLIFNRVINLPIKSNNLR